MFSDPKAVIGELAGPGKPETCEVVSSVGVVPWITPELAMESDGAPGSNPGKSYAIIDNQTTHYLKCTDFRLTVPQRATVDGITVTWERESSGGTVMDHAVRIVKGGAIGSADRLSPNSWPAADGPESYGGPADSWGETWQIGDINAAGFGTAISATALAAEEARIDSVTITVAYTMLALNSPDPGAICGDQPETGCSGADVRSSLLLTDRTAVDPSKKSLLWKFRDSRSSVSDFFDPRSDTKYVLCLYDTTAGVYHLAIDKGTEPSGGVALPAGNDPEGKTCVIKRSTGEIGDCWTVLQRGLNPSTGYRYRDRRRRSDWGNLTNGTRTVWLRAGRSGELFGGSIFFRASGINLPALSGTTVPNQLLDQQSEVLVQLVNSKGSCWEASYTSPPHLNRPFRGGLLFRDQTD